MDEYSDFTFFVDVYFLCCVLRLTSGGYGDGNEVYRAKDAEFQWRRCE